MTRFLRYVTTADGDVISELDIDIPEPTHHHDPRRTRRWQTRPVEDPRNQGDQR